MLPNGSISWYHERWKENAAASDLSWLTPGSMQISELGTIRVDDSTLKTGIPGVPACGDIVSGPTSIVEAVASAKKVAVA